MRPRSLTILPAAALFFAFAGSSAADEPPPSEGDPDSTEHADPKEAAPPTDDEAAPEVETVDSLRKEYIALRDKLFRSRARAAAVASALYSTRLTLYLHHEGGRHFTVTRATVRLDGANVFDDLQGTISEDKAPRFEGFVAPGRHLVAVRIEATAKDDERFSTIIENQFSIQAPPSKDVRVVMKAADPGDLPYRWRKKGSGTYDLRLAVEVESRDRKKKGDEPKLRGN